MVADIDLPVWSFRPTWSNGIRETLAWQTDVIGQLMEQRRAIRLTPRRAFEFDVLAENESRTFLTLLLHRLGANEFMFPHWIDVVRFDAGVAAGTDRLEFDTAYSEYAEGLGILIGESPFNHEVVEIISVDAGGVDLANPTVRTFTSGVRFYPMLRGRLQQEQSVDRLLQRLGRATLRFNVTKANPRTVPVEVPTLYRGEPVLEAWPDERETLNYQFNRVMHELDPGYGLTHVLDEGGRAHVAEAYNWMLKSKAERASFYDMLWRLKGRRQQRWIPSFAQDLRLAQNATSGAATIHIRECGYGYVGGPYEGRQDIRVEMQDGTAYHRRITGIADAPAGQEELVLDTPIPIALTPDTVKRITFIDVGRMDQDSIEILHQTNTVATARTAFRTISTGRTTAGAIELAIPASYKINGACGDCDPSCSPPPPEIPWSAATAPGPTPNGYWSLYCENHIGFWGGGTYIADPNSYSSMDTGPWPCGSFIDGPMDQATWDALMAVEPDPAHHKVLEIWRNVRSPSGLVQTLFMRSWVWVAT